MTEKEYWYWLCNIPEIYPSQIKAMLKRFETPEDIFKATENDLREINKLDEKEIQSLLKSRKKLNFIKDLETLERDGIHFIYFNHQSYPLQLKSIPDAPYALYVRGNLPDPDKYSVGMVGARKCSGYGKEIALKYSKNLASRDIQIISGMALGIDAYSSKGAIEVGGKTFVVLGTGVDVIYPLENFELYFQIIASGGGIISEFPPGTAGNPINFPHRNRIISGLSDKLLIIEARKRSGTLTTAQHALNQNVDIYAVPGRITDKLSEGCNRLIADGCGVLINIEDFLYDLYQKQPKASKSDYQKTINEIKVEKSTANMKSSKVSSSKNNNVKRESSDNELDNKQKIILKELNFMPVSTDVIIEKTGLPANEVQIALAELELTGLVEEVSKDVFIRTN